MDNLNNLIAWAIIADYFRQRAKRQEERALRDASKQPSDEHRESLLNRIVRRMRTAAARPPASHPAGRAPAH